MTNPAPGFSTHPGYSITLASFEGAVSVSVDGNEIGQTDQAIILAEASYPAVFYLPKKTLPEGMLIISDHRTWCPFKGHASYYHLAHGDQTHENAIWSYQEPFDEALAIKDHIAFYPNVASVTPIE
ncbi:MAG: DUF427 domain-containing protein [Rhizobiaceae bacterium]